MSTEEEYNFTEVQVICERVAVLVVCDQPLESSVHHCTSDTEVPMALVGPLLPDDNDIQFRGKVGLADSEQRRPHPGGG